MIHDIVMTEAQNFKHFMSQRAIALLFRTLDAASLFRPIISIFTSIDAGAIFNRNLTRMHASANIQTF